MGFKNYLTPEAKQELQKPLKFHDHPDLREWILIFLLRKDGRTQQEIADLIGRSFTWIDEDLEALVYNLLNEGQLVISWDRKIRSIRKYKENVMKCASA